MFMNIGSKLCGWLAGLALYPVEGWGLGIIEHPQDATVCLGTDAVFMSKVDGGLTGWIFNGTISGDLPPNVYRALIFYDKKVDDESVTLKVTVPSSEPNFALFNNIKVQSAVRSFSSSIVSSTIAYLFYEINQQHPVTGLTAIANKTTVLIQWDKLDSSLTTRFLVGIYDGANNPVHSTGFLTTSDTHYTHHLDQDSICYELEFRVTGVEIQYPHCNDAEQTTSTSIRVAYQDTNLNIDPVILGLSGQKVLANWPPDHNSTLIVITNLKNGNQTQIIYNGTSPYVQTETACGYLNRNVAVSPAQCAEPAFTHNANISIDRPTTIETGITDQSSDTQANYPSVLLAIAAVIPLLKWQH